jgi:hypothetical protein
MTPIDGEPPWLALYRAETERLEAITRVLSHPDLDLNCDFASELCTVILDIAGRSAVRDFVPARLAREHVA